MKSQDTCLEARELVVAYNEHEVLKKIDLHLKKGEILGVVGPNGSGKSTLIRALTGLVPAKCGRVLLNDKPLEQYTQSERAQKMAVVPQAMPILFEFTVREIVEMGRYPHLSALQHMRKQDRECIENALRLADIAHLQDRRMDQLSSGEWQRVILARALAQKSNILLMDEPTSHLDLGHQLQVFEMMMKLAREEGVSILCVSHDLNLAAEYFERLILMSEGKIYKEGSPAEVITEKNLLAVYGAAVMVKDHPTSGKPLVVIQRKIHEVIAP